MKKNHVDVCLEFNPELLLSKLVPECRQALKDCEFFDEIDSTNQYLLTRVNDETTLPRVCFANRQTQGRGRRGRCWESSGQENIYMSLAYLFAESSQEVGNLSLVMGIAVSRVLRQRGVDAAIKWPNDILVGGEKIAGILIETKMKAGQQVLMVIGVGLNVKMKEHGRNIDQPWTDIYQQLGELGKFERSELAGDLLSEIMLLIDEYRQQGFKKFKDEFGVLDLCYQQQLSIETNGKTLTGKGLGVDEQGRLCVEIDDKPQCFYAAEVSIRIPVCC